MFFYFRESLNGIDPLFFAKVSFAVIVALIALAKRKMPEIKDMFCISVIAIHLGIGFLFVFFLGGVTLVIYYFGVL